MKNEFLIFREERKCDICSVSISLYIWKKYQGICKICYESGAF